MGMVRDQALPLALTDGWVPVGTIDSDELTSALTTIGEKMSAEEVKKMIEAVGTNSRGRIQIAVLAHYLLGN